MLHHCHALHRSADTAPELCITFSSETGDTTGGMGQVDPHSSDELSNELPAVAAWRGIHSYAEQATLAVPCCIGNEKLLCMNRVLQRQPRELQIHPHV